VVTATLSTDRPGGARRAGPAWKERVLTLEEFLDLPEAKPALEFEEGRATQKVSPKLRHSTLQGAFVESVNRTYRRRKLAHAFPELRVTFGGRSFVPDVSVFRWDRIPRTTSGEVADDVFVAPDIAVEVVSPKQSVNALLRRCLTYTGLGVRIALLVDPADRSVVLFRPGVDTLALRGADRIDLDDILPGYRLTADALFQSLRIA
jgi:Uma2 family endonuclease